MWAAPKMDGIICFGLFDLFAFSSVCLYLFLSVFLIDSFLSLHFTCPLHLSLSSSAVFLSLSSRLLCLTQFLFSRTSACTGLWLAVDLISVST